MRGISIGFGIGIKYQNALRKGGGGVVPPAPEQPDLLLWDNGTEVLWDNEKSVELFKIPDAIRKSMVVWYDVAKQNATNESMQANPVLKDFSGNGHDATCYNFAWAGMSGIGGYNVDFLSDYATLNYISRTGTTFVAKPGVSGGWFIHTQKSSPSFTIKVTGLSGIEFSYCSRDSEDHEIRTLIKEDGIYTLPESVNPNNKYCGFIYGLGTSSEFTIEILPQYPGALVYDGVDDYAAARQLPIFTKETGYTIIVKRDILTFEVEGINWVVASNRNTGSETGAFSFEKYGGKSNEPGYKKLKTYSFGNYSEVATERPTEQVSWQTSKLYNGKSIIQGNSVGSHVLVIGANTQNQNADNAFEFSNVALYSLLLFDRDLTTSEIEWVKTNLIEQ